jgi:hypothetical protein
MAHLPRHTVERPEADLQTCPACRRPFVVPAAVVDVVGHDRYVVELTCTNCPWSEVAVHEEAALEDLDRRLERSVAAMQAAAEIVEIAAELERIDRFAAALRADLVLPEDF